MLIVDGDLKISGKGRWDGIIIVKDDAEMCGGGKGYHLYGTILILDESGNDKDNEFKFSGASSAAYSTSTIEKVQDDVRTMSVNTWRQTASL